MPFVHAAPPPPFPEETLVCVRAAANEFAVSPVALLSILKVEGGKAGEVHQNRNGTVDYGVMQVNSLWISSLSGKRRSDGSAGDALRVGSAGVATRLLRNDDCYNIRVGAWILSRNMHRITTSPTAWWQAVARYHSKSRLKNIAYARRLETIATRDIIFSGWW